MPVIRRLVIAAATILVLVVLVLDLLSFVGWPDDGPVALAQVFAAHLTLVAVFVIPVAFLHEAGVLRVSLIALVVVSLVRFGGEWWSWPSGAPDDASTLEVMTFNLEVGSQAAAQSVEFLQRATARVIALQELTPDVAAAIGTDPILARQYPHQALYPSQDVLGMGLLSADPISQVSFDRDPSRLFATVVGPLGPIRVLNVHPLHDEIRRGPLGAPVSYDTADRAVGLDRIRESVAADDGGRPVVLLGDVNTAPTEPAYGRFTSGLRDAHAEVGLGPGWTYRPDALEWLGVGLLRIDAVLTGPGLRPVAETTTCPTVGDHCAVIVTLVADPG